MSNGYKDLIVWQKGTKFCVNIYKLTEQFPDSERFGLISQLRRAAVSIPSNIAEGSKRNTNKDQTQFYSIAYGSGAEVETQLQISKDLFPLLSGEINLLENDLTEIMKMLNRLRSQKHNSLTIN